MKDSVISTLRVVSLMALPLLSLSGCGRGDSPEAGSGLEGASPPAARPMSEKLQGLVDQGNEAQRAGLYQEAMAHYQEAMAEAPDHPIPQFGALMAAMALGDSALAESLRTQLAVTAPELVDMLNPDGSMGGMPANPHGGMGGMGMPPMGGTGEGGLPPGHPALMEVAPDTVRPDTSGGF